MTTMPINLPNNVKNALSLRKPSTINEGLYSNWPNLDSSASIGKFPIMEEEALSQMAKGTIPDLRKLCLDLWESLHHVKAPYSALQFIPILKKFDLTDEKEIDRFLQNPKTNHVLVDNGILKVVLIHWKPGKKSSIHGHPRGGCVFKVLQGSLEEQRFSANEEQRFLGVTTLLKDGMGYIDDQMAYHAIGNPNGKSALSIHVYTH